MPTDRQRQRQRGATCATIHCAGGKNKPKLHYLHRALHRNERTNKNRKLLDRVLSELLWFSFVYFFFTGIVVMALLTFLSSLFFFLLYHLCSFVECAFSSSSSVSHLPCACFLYFCDSFCHLELAVEHFPYYLNADLTVIHCKLYVNSISMHSSVQIINPKNIYNYFEIKMHFLTIQNKSFADAFATETNALTIKRSLFGLHIANSFVPSLSFFFFCT